MKGFAGASGLFECHKGVVLFYDELAKVHSVGVLGEGCDI